VFPLSSLPSQEQGLAEVLAFPAVALLFSCFGWLPYLCAQGELVQTGNFLESPGMDPCLAPCLAQCSSSNVEKPIFLFLRHFFQPGWVSLAGGTLRRQRSRGDGGGKQERPAVILLGKALLAEGWQANKREGDFRVHPQQTQP